MVSQKARVPVLAPLLQGCVTLGGHLASRSSVFPPVSRSGGDALPNGGSAAWMERAAAGALLLGAAPLQRGAASGKHQGKGSVIAQGLGQPKSRISSHCGLSRESNQGQREAAWATD